MRRAVVRHAADAIAALSLTMAVAAFVLLLVGPGVRGSDTGFALGTLFYGGIGWLLARKVPGNAIGWSFAAGGLFWAAAALATSWGRLALAGQVPLDTLARVCLVLPFIGWIFPVSFSLQLPLLLLPDGRLPSRRWRPVLWLLGLGMASGAVGFTTYFAPIEDTDPALRLMNPFGVRALGKLPLAVGLTGAAMLAVVLLAGGVALILRFRRSVGVERQQLRWVAFGGSCAVLGQQTQLLSVVPDVVQQIIGVLAFFAVPACVGVAVLRYRLYDLGRLVSRTVSYALISAILLGVYLGLVSTLVRLLPDSSSLAVAASTLAVAALFQPLRRRVQTLVDRRFNRARYDADRTVEVFTRRLREQVDLDEVRADLLHVVHDTMQPASLGLWLRDAGR